MQDQFRIIDENDLIENLIFFDPESNQSKCAMPNCDGTGNINQIYSTHTKAKNCPKNPKNRIIIDQNKKIAQMNDQINVLSNNLKDYPDRLTELISENMDLKVMIENLNKEIVELNKKGIKFKIILKFFFKRINFRYRN